MDHSEESPNQVVPGLRFVLPGNPGNSTTPNPPAVPPIFGEPGCDDNTRFSPRSATVRSKNILIAAGIDPSPLRAESPWADFIMMHAKTLWATDFFSKKVWTLRGFVDVFVLFFINIDSRKVYLAGITTHPDNTWMKQQARNLCMHWDKEKVKPTHLIRDFDGKYTKDFDAILDGEGVEVKRVGPQKPNMNAFAERFVQSIKQECLDNFICFGEDHLRYLCTEYVAWYNHERPHQAKGNVPLKKTRCRKWKDSDWRVR